MVLSALLFALITPIVTMVMASFAQNKVEGLAIFKVLNLGLLLPILGLFLTPPFNYFFGLIPVYWSFLYLAGANDLDLDSWIGLVAVGYHLLAIGGLFWFFHRRYYH